MEVFVDKEQKKKELDAFGVHDLRHMARNLGVSRPTMKIKEELIEEIAEILVGDASAKQGSGRGRNPAVKLAQFGAADFILPPALQALVKKREAGQGLQGDMPAAAFAQGVHEKLVFSNLREGFLQSQQGEYYFWDLNTEKMVYVNPNIVRGNELQIGDRVSARCAESPAVTFAVAEEVLSINFDTKFLPRNFCSFKNDVLHKNSSHFTFGGIEEGEAMLFPEKLEGQALDDFAKTFKKFAENGFKILLSGTSVKERVFVDVSSKFPCEDAVTYITNTRFTSLTRIKNVIQHCVLRAASGEKILLAIFDVKQLLEDVEYSLQFETQNPGIATFDSARFLGYLTNFKRLLNNGGSLTIVAFNA